MKIWIDLYAAPDPFFFRPIIEKIQALGHSTYITSRDYNETVNVARHCALHFEVIGRHGGERLYDRVGCACQRVWQLTRFAAKLKPDVAVSFNSYSQAITSALLNIRFVTFMDYEYHPLNHVAFRIADAVVVPTGYDAEMLSKQVGKRDKVRWFPGLKEEVSATSFKPDLEFREKLRLLGVRPSDILVTMRPPPEYSIYHRFDNDLFYELLAYMAAQSKVKVIYLPRNPSQLKRVVKYRLDNIITPMVFLDGFQLVYHSDLVISAGGSMNREAVVLGTPAYTTFKGKLAGVDRKLIEAGSLKRISFPRQFADIAMGKKEDNALPRAKVALLDCFAEMICYGAEGHAIPVADDNRSVQEAPPLLSCPAKIHRVSEPKIKG